MTFCPAVFNCNVASLDETFARKTLEERGKRIGDLIRRASVQIADHRHHGLLRVRGERPRGCRTKEKRDELAPPHSITSSAVTSSDGGIVSPSALAVLRLIMSSYLVGCWTGNSVGLVPLRIRSM